MRFTKALLPILLAAASASIECDAAVIRLDADPSQTGIQSTLNVTQGQTFSIDVIVQDALYLSAFRNDGSQSSIIYDNDILSTTSIVDGNFIATPSTESSETIGADGSVSFVRWHSPIDGVGEPANSSSEGVLFSVNYTADLVGSTNITFENVNPSPLPPAYRFRTGENGVEYNYDQGTPFDTIAINVAPSSAAVPEPSVFGLGTVVVLGFARRWRKLLRTT
ncbi:MAG: hypothetical protein Fues2KO_54200 [Fuerstiella sp.]